VAGGAGVSPSIGVGLLPVGLSRCGRQLNGGRLFSWPACRRTCSASRTHGPTPVTLWPTHAVWLAPSGVWRSSHRPGVSVGQPAHPGSRPVHRRFFQEYRGSAPWWCPVREHAYCTAHDPYVTPNCFLLTGADGYVGRHLSACLRARGQVVGLSRSGRAGIACDLRDLRAVGELARAVAAHVHRPRSGPHGPCRV
jgi:hypothetical protein